MSVEGERAGATLAALVRELAPGASWSRARDLCRSGRVRVDGRVETDPARRPPPGSLVEIAEVDARALGAPGAPGAPIPRPGALPAVAILHADADVAVVTKPAGLLTVPFGPGDRDTLLALARVALRRRETARGLTLSPTLRAVQRLDKETSGVVVFARSVAAQRHLQRQLGEHSVLRRYLAIAHGAVAAATYETYLVEDRGDGLRGSWGGVFRAGRGAPPPGARPAVTHVEPLERLRGASLAACTLETGRQHQIRIHLAEAGHPLVGETVYVRDYRGPRIPAPRPMLHAAELGFEHPRTGETVRFAAPPPADFEEILDRLRR